MKRSFKQHTKRKEIAAAGVCLSHIAREFPDIRRLADFYKAIFGFEEVEAPTFEGVKVLWLMVPGNLAFHFIERNPSFNLPEGPFAAKLPESDPVHLGRGHHICFTFSNLPSLVQTLKEKGIQTSERCLDDGTLLQQVFFFDIDGMGWRLQHLNEFHSTTEGSFRMVEWDRYEADDQ